MDEMQLDFYTKTEVDEKFGGMVIEKISKTDFDALTTKDPDTIYFVYDENGNIVQYIGDAALSGGVSADMATINISGATGTAGHAEEVNL